MTVFPMEPDWGAGRFCGPTSDATVSFPAGVYLKPEEWLRWQDEEQLKLNEAAEVQFAAALKTGGFSMPNPYTPYVAALKARLGV